MSTPCPQPYSLLTFGALFFSVLLIALGGCARIGTPTGGPVDETPPRIVQTTPIDSSLQVDRFNSVVFRFSEWMSERSVNDALFISPYPDPYPRSSWHRRELRLEFAGGLLSDRTYVVTIGTGARDLHGVALDTAFTLAFSTGPTLDRGEIQGRILQFNDVGGIEPASQVLISAYRLGTAGIPDSLTGNTDPREDWGEYETQSGTDGTFHFSFLAPGRYRVIAIDDRDRNTLVDEGEEFALPVHDIRLFSADEVQELPDMLLSPRDGAGPGLISATAPDRNHLILRFDEPVHMPSISVAITDPETLSVTVLAADTLWSNMIWCITERQIPETEYGLTVSAEDRWANATMLASDSTTFRSSARSDTVGPKIVISTVRSVAFRGHSVSITLVFDDQIQGNPQVMLRQMEDSSVVPTLSHWDFPNRMHITTPELPTPGRKNWWLDPVGIIDAFGNTSTDSVKIEFRVLPGDSLGEIAGNLSLGTFLLDGNNSSDQTPVVVVLPLLGGEKRRTLTGISGEPFHFDNVPAGRYVLRAWKDVDGDGRWSPGRVAPYLPAEEFTTTDTVTVRARWTTSDVNIEF